MVFEFSIISRHDKEGGAARDGILAKARIPMDERCQSTWQRKRISSQQCRNPLK